MSVKVCPSCYAVKQCDCGMTYMDVEEFRAGLVKQGKSGILACGVGSFLVVCGLTALVFVKFVAVGLFVGAVACIVRGVQMQVDARTRYKELERYVPQLPPARVV